MCEKALMYHVVSVLKLTQVYKSNFIESYRMKFYHTSNFAYLAGKLSTQELL